MPVLPPAPERLDDLAVRRAQLAADRARDQAALLLEEVGVDDVCVEDARKLDVRCPRPLADCRETRQLSGG